MIAPVAAGSATWYLTRSTGLVALVLLTVSVVLGILDVRRFQARGWPRFVIDGLHRNVSLLVLVLLAVHILTSVLDGFAPISILDAVVPFTGAYRPLWLGLGALSFDLLLAVVITSLVRVRLGHRTWRAVHWLAYVSFPVAVVHGLGTGTDAPQSWMLVITIACLLAVVVAAATRVVAGWPEPLVPRAAASFGLLAVPVFLVAWLPGGPLGRGWARRSGTPPSLLGHRGGVLAATGSALASATAPAPALGAPFSAAVSGREQVVAGDGGTRLIDLSLKVGGGRRLDLRLSGLALPGGGVSLQSSQVFLGTAAAPTLFRGAVTGVQGGRIAARVQNGTQALALTARLVIDHAGGVVQGTLDASRDGGA